MLIFIGIAVLRGEIFIYAPSLWPVKVGIINIYGSLNGVFVSLRAWERRTHAKAEAYVTATVPRRKGGTGL